MGDGARAHDDHQTGDAPGRHVDLNVFDARARSHDLIARISTGLGAAEVRVSIAAGVALAALALAGGVLAITKWL